jgi:hypothetical protein
VTKLAILTKQSGYYLNLFHERNLLSYLCWLTHPGLNVSAPTFKSCDQYIRETDARNRESVCGLPEWSTEAVSEKKILRNQPTRNKNCLWQPCLLTDRDEISILYRGPSIDASYQVSVHSAILISHWLISKKSFPLKPLSQMN